MSGEPKAEKLEEMKQRNNVKTLPVFFATVTRQSRKCIRKSSKG